VIVLIVQVDQFSRHRRDFLAVWAAGNEGDAGLFTVGSPATAKNMLCVGAQQSTAASLMKQDHSHSKVFIKLLAPGEEQEVLAEWANFGPRSEEGLQGELARPDPHADACGTVNDMHGKVALVERGKCEFTEKVKNVEAAGAVAMVVYDNTVGPTVVMGGKSDVAPTIPSVSISRHDGEWARSRLAAGMSVAPSATGADLWQQGLAGFSAKGPTGDGRLMPHIVAPGADIWSARHDRPPPPLPY